MEWIVDGVWLKEEIGGLVWFIFIVGYEPEAPLPHTTSTQKINLFRFVLFAPSLITKERDEQPT